MKVPRLEDALMKMPPVPGLIYINSPAFIISNTENLKYLREKYDT